MIANLFLGRDAFLDFIVSVTGMALIIPALFWLFFGERECTVRTKENGEQVWGVGKSSNVGRAGIAAVVSALNFKSR